MELREGIEPTSSDYKTEIINRYTIGASLETTHFIL